MFHCATLRRQGKAHDRVCATPGRRRTQVFRQGLQCCRVIARLDFEIEGPHFLVNRRAISPLWENRDGVIAPDQLNDLRMDPLSGLNKQPLHDCWPRLR